jgi:PAS domain S-box-containing protein
MSVLEPIAPQELDDPLLAWRRRAVKRLFRLFLLILLPLTLLSIANQISLERWVFAGFQLTVVVLILVLWLARGDDYRFLGGVLVGHFIVAALSSLVAVGLFGVHTGLIFVVAVLSALLLGRRASAIAVALHLAGFVTILALFGLGLLPYPYEATLYAAEWQVILNNVVIGGGLCALLVIMVNSLVSSLKASFQATQAALTRLEQLNSGLEETVAARTDELRRSQGLLQALLNHSPAAIYVKDLDGHYLLTNRYMHTVHSLDSAQMEGQRDIDLFGALAEPWRAHEQAVIAAEGPVSMEAMIKDEGGLRHYYEIKFPLRGEAGEIRAIGGIAVDITDRKETDQALATQLSYAEALSRCSRILLAPVTTEAEFQQALTQALDVVREAVGGDRLTLAHYAPPGADNAQMMRSYSRVASSERPGLPPLSTLSAEEIADMPTPLNIWRQGGGSFNGPVAGQFPAHPIYERYAADNQIAAAFIQSVELGGRWWGHLSMVHHSRTDGWDAGAVQLLRTALEMLITFTESWATAKALQEREALLASELRYAEAVARCSQILVVAAADVAAWEPIVEQALRTLREAVGCTRIGLNLFPMPDAVFDTQMRRVADQLPGTPPFQHLPIEPADLSPRYIEAVRGGEILAGSVDELFPPPSSINTSFTANGQHSLLIAGVHIDGAWRGYLVASDADRERRWDEPVTRLIRTGLEIITAFIHQQEMAAALRASEAQLRAVGDNLPNGFVYQLERDREWRSRFVYLSSGVEQILGVSPEEGLRDADAIHQLVRPEDNERNAQISKAAAASGRDFKEVIPHHLPSGETRWLYVCSRARRQPDGAVVWDGVAVDITEQQRAAEELARARDAAEAATRAKSAFLASMSHEIRTPLNAVIGVAGMLKETELSDEQQLLVETIYTSGQALLSVISDVLDFSRIESGNVELELHSFDLHACLEGSIDLVAYGAREKGLQLHCRLAPSLPQAVMGDETRLRQVMLNLLSNAVKFTQAGEVTVEAAAALAADGRALVCITVRDTGIGMTEAQLKRVFAPFVQGDSSTARRYGGSGLGLAISRQLVELMGGSIEVSSLPGAGSAFTVRLALPLSSGAALPQLDAPVAAAEGGLQILVAEDNPVNQMVIRRMLLNLHHHVSVVEDGLAVLEAVVNTAYDVVLMDLQMPELDGEAATRKIRQLLPAAQQPVIIALTANAFAADRERLLRAGADDYLTKPVEPAQLQRALARVTARRAVAAGVADVRPGEEGPVPLIAWSAFDQMAASMEPAGQERRAVTTLVELFQQAVPPQIAAIEAAVEAADVAGLRRRTHRLRGGCLQVGARAMAALAQRLEEADDAAEIAALVVELHACYAETLALLRRRSAEV